MNVPPKELVATHFGHVPKGSVLSYQLTDYEKPAHKSKLRVGEDFPQLPIAAVGNVLSVPTNISNEQQARLDKLKVTLEEAHQLEQSTQQQSSSVKANW